MFQGSPIAPPEVRKSSHSPQSPSESFPPTPECQASHEGCRIQVLTPATWPVAWPARSYLPWESGTGLQLLLAEFWVQAHSQTTDPNPWVCFPKRDPRRPHPCREAVHSPKSVSPPPPRLLKRLILFIYFWLRWVLVAVRGLLIAVASLVAEHEL